MLGTGTPTAAEGLRFFAENLEKNRKEKNYAVTKHYRSA
jgi:hypothetical protein